MYLTEIDPKTGLVILDDIESGVLAIKDFRDLINHPDFGIHCFTAVALTADYRSPIKYYNDIDRPRKAMEEVTGNRDAYVWKEEIIQKALVKYRELQYDPTIEEGEIHYQRKVNKLNEIKMCDLPPEKDKDGNDIPRKSISTLTADLRSINSDIKAYEDNILGKDIYSEAPTKGKYTLTRLEQKLLKKVSFYTSIR